MLYTERFYVVKSSNKGLTFISKFYIKCKRSSAYLRYDSNFTVISSVRKSLVLSWIYDYKCTIIFYVFPKQKRYTSWSIFCLCCFRFFDYSLFESATEIYKRRQDIGKITTGTNCLDSLLDGGVETQALTEVYGEYGCGKTQFCHSLCVQVQRSKEEGGLDGSVLYIDTENTFRPERIVSIANANGMDPEKVLDRIIVARAYNSAHQTLILEESGPVIKEHNVKLLIADSAVGLFRAGIPWKRKLSARQQKLFHCCIWDMSFSSNLECVLIP